MFDPEKVATAATFQAACPGWLIFWSPALRAFTAIAAFVPDQAVVINAPSTHSLLHQIGAVELATGIGGSPVKERIAAGAQCSTDERPSPGPPSETDRAVRPHHPHGRHSPRGRHSPGGGHPADKRAAAWSTPARAPIPSYARG